MVLIKEYRVVLPCSVEEYQVGQLFSVAEASKNETGGGEGIEVLKNEPYEKDGEKGQYTHKIYHLKRCLSFFAFSKCNSVVRPGSGSIVLSLFKVPGFVKCLPLKAPWYFMKKPGMPTPTAEPNEYMKDNFFIKIETWHKPDLGTQENNVAVVPIDIADRSEVSAADYKPDEDPAKFKSAKTGRGPLGPAWKKELVSKTDRPRMCAYKLVTVKFKWWGLQTKVENFIHEQEKRIFNNFHRQLFCWIDKWVELNMTDIRRMEAETQNELDEVSE
ncbi:hypothetical protein F7725_012888 [Dissostichus mawsoni]|uniref:Phosphatidylinositol transfer protein beta isoform n=1 Tax=Dissostichus mawsoni TaxID=36200 RepID=A0A7J5YNM3_DISMA|nr:hypothetical protein F7725_012888 [Dissostichus mawsoni]